MKIVINNISGVENKVNGLLNIINQQEKTNGFNDLLNSLLNRNNEIKSLINKLNAILKRINLNKEINIDIQTREKLNEIDNFLKKLLDYMDMLLKNNKTKLDDKDIVYFNLFVSSINNYVNSLNVNVNDISDSLDNKQVNNLNIDYLIKDINVKNENKDILALDNIINFNEILDNLNMIDIKQELQQNDKIKTNFVDMFKNNLEEIIKSNINGYELNREIHIKLEPKFLGKIEVYIKNNANKIDLVLNSDNIFIKQILNDLHNDIQNIFNRNGYDLNSFSYNSNFSQGNSQNDNFKEVYSRFKTYINANSEFKVSKNNINNVIKKYNSNSIYI